MQHCSCPLTTLSAELYMNELIDPKQKRRTVDLKQQFNLKQQWTGYTLIFCGGELLNDWKVV